VAYFVPIPSSLAILLTFLAYFLGILITYQGPFDMVPVLGERSLEPPFLFHADGPPGGRRVQRGQRTPEPADHSPPGRLSLPPPGGRSFSLAVFTALCSFFQLGPGDHRRSLSGPGKWEGRVPRVDYPLLVAGAFIGMCAGNLGIFSSDPQVVRKAATFLERPRGLPSQPGDAWNPAALVGFLAG